MRIISDSTGYDAATVSLADAVSVVDKAKPWLIVGGHMVNLHIVRAGLKAPLRETRDADLAVELKSITEGGLVGRLMKLGYENRVYHNRFDREVDGLALSIDLVVPSGSTKHQPNIDALVIKVDGMPALDAAFKLKPTIVELKVDLTSGARREFAVQIPDAVTGVAMKSFAVAERTYSRDAEDLGYLLEVAAADHGTWPDHKIFVTAARQLSAQFDTPGSALAQAAPDNPDRQARLREITRSLVGRP